jgi:SAM-dependent methyltransferase
MSLDLMKIDPERRADLHAIAARTLGHYDANAEGFREGTRDHDVSQNVAALLDAIARPAPLRILDLGCGPGRDLATFRDLGHTAIGLEGSAAFVAMARRDTGCEVLHQSFFDLDVGALEVDGVFANASLFHVPSAVLHDVLVELRGALVAGGVLFCSNPRAQGEAQEGWQGDRYGTYLTVDRWKAALEHAGFDVLRTYLRPAGKPPAQQPWVALVSRKRA